MNKTKIKACALALSSSLLAACTTPLPPIPRANNVDLPQFMGSWYVIACIPTLIEKDIYNAVESYQLNADGTIATTFTFNKGAPDGPNKEYKPRGFVVPNTGNAEWKMQFIWPVKSEFLIAHVDPDYSTTVIARTARDYVWIMSRTPQVSDSKYASLKQLVADMGYDLSKLVPIQHQPK